MEELREEHQNTRYVLHLLNLAASRWEAGEPVAIELFIQGAGVLQKYAEDFHQNLEEGVLFPLMEREGVPHSGGPLEVLQKEHRECGRYLNDLQAALTSAHWQEPAVRETVVENIKAYTNLLKAHMDKEEMIVYPIAERLVGESEIRRDERIERLVNPVQNQENLQLIQELEKELGLQPNQNWEAMTDRHPEESDILAEEFLRRDN